MLCQPKYLINTPAIYGPSERPRYVPAMLMPRARPLSSDGMVAVRIARLLVKAIPEPTPCRARPIISKGTEAVKATMNEEIIVRTRPMMNILRRPKISASLPEGTMIMASPRKKIVFTQLITTASIFKSRAIDGKATLTEATRKGMINEVTVAIISTMFLLIGTPESLFVVRVLLLIESPAIPCWLC